MQQKAFFDHFSVQQTQKDIFITMHVSVNQRACMCTERADTYTALLQTWEIDKEAHYKG